MDYLYLILAFTLNAVANILLKIGSEFGVKITNYYLFAGIALFAINIIFYFLALKNLALSTAYPIMIVMSFLIINRLTIAWFWVFIVSEKNSPPSLPLKKEKHNQCNDAHKNHCKSEAV